ncbi:MAG: hypothetical protein JWN15_526 [Firmicutes bacterium]|nr:hypothetical protein [Bacillota bacterium]
MPRTPTAEAVGVPAQVPRTAGSLGRTQPDAALLVRVGPGNRVDASGRRLLKRSAASSATSEVAGSEAAAVKHSSRGAELASLGAISAASHTSLGTATHTSLGTAEHTGLGTAEHTSLGTAKAAHEAGAGAIKGSAKGLGQGRLGGGAGGRTVSNRHTKLASRGEGNGILGPECSAGGVRGTNPGNARAGAQADVRLSSDPLQSRRVLDQGVTRRNAKIRPRQQASNLITLGADSANLASRSCRSSRIASLHPARTTDHACHLGTHPPVEIVEYLGTTLSVARRGCSIRNWRMQIILQAGAD